MEELIPLSTHRKTTLELIAQHPLLAFTILAYAISWTAWFLMYLSGFGVFNGLGMIGAMGPAIAAMILSAILKPEPSNKSMKTRLKLFGILSISLLAILFFRRLWLTKELTNISGRIVTSQIYPSFIVFLLDALAAMVASFILSGFLSSRQGVVDLLRSLDLRRQKTSWFWYIVALGVYPIVIIVGNVISAGIGLPRLSPKATGPLYLLILDVLLAFLVTLFGGGGLEEPGWRGFALPLLRKRTNPFIASLILAVIWAFWHWPMFWLGYYGGGPLGVFSFLIGCIPISFLFTAISHWTKCSLLIAILLHTSFNITSTFLPISSIGSGLWWLILLCVGIWLWRWPQSYS